ncbi:MAG: hypothetical protein QOD25_879, partial [Alphaproteobacteria bacterium]|nr:hypothetical protein [Alphaproteobacteria bacterium]
MLLEAASVGGLFRFVLECPSGGWR